MNRTFRVIILLLLTAIVIVGCGKSGDDLIVLQIGSQQTGTLQACVNTSCELDNQSIPRSSIAWIGFAYAGNKPPPITNPVADEIHARDGSVASAHLIGISDSKVVTDKQSYERTQVAWIHLASTTANASPPGSHPPASDETCNFWMGDVRTQQTNRRGSVAAPGQSVRNTAYHVRLREGARISEVSFEVPLINAGSLVEGSIEDEATGAKGPGTSGAYRTSGSGKASVSDPGTNFGSVGHLTITPAGQRVSYRFTLNPDSKSSTFPATTHRFIGDPPRPDVQEVSVWFMSAQIGEGADSQSPRGITDSGRLMEGKYSSRNPDQGWDVSWSLHAITAPCDQPPPADTTSSAPSHDS